MKITIAPLILRLHVKLFCKKVKSLAPTPFYDPFLLFMTKSLIVNLFGGSIDVENVDGGARLTVRLKIGV